VRDVGHEDRVDLVGDAARSRCQSIASEYADAPATMTRGLCSSASFSASA